MKDVDPKLMQGFKLELFSSKITGADMVAQIREVAKARGIDVLVHDLNANFLLTRSFRRHLITNICIKFDQASPPGAR